VQAKEIPAGPPIVVQYQHINQAQISACFICKTGGIVLDVGQFIEKNAVWLCMKL
jgi:hypothetical protein